MTALMVALLSLPLTAHHCYGIAEQEIPAVIGVAQNWQAPIVLTGHRYSKRRHSATHTVELWLERQYESQEFEIYLFCLRTDALLVEQPPRDTLLAGTQSCLKKTGEAYLSVEVGLYLPGVYRVIVVDKTTRAAAAFDINRPL